MNLRTVKWAQWDKTQSRELLGLFIYVCIALCTIVGHSIAQNTPDNFPSYPPDNHHCSDDVYFREGGLMTKTGYIIRLNGYIFSVISSRAEQLSRPSAFARSSSCRWESRGRRLLQSASSSPPTRARTGETLLETKRTTVNSQLVAWRERVPQYITRGIPTGNSPNI